MSQKAIKRKSKVNRDTAKRVMAGFLAGLTVFSFVATAIIYMV